jgi:large subunit ribosomal protein L1
MAKKLSKNLVKARALVEPRPYTLIDAVPLLKKAKYAKFDETVDLTCASASTPSTPTRWSAGRSFCRTAWARPRSSPSSPRATRSDAEAAGAEFFGGEELVEKIQKEGWTAFDALIATPDMMKSVGRLGKVLGPKGLMPNPKTGTVTTDVVAAIKEIKAGKVEFRTDKTALVHVPVGKLSFDPQKLVDNAMTVITSVLKAKPSAAKGKYIKGITSARPWAPASSSTRPSGCRAAGKA